MGQVPGLAAAARVPEEQVPGLAAGARVPEENVAASYSGSSRPQFTHPFLVHGRR